MEMKQNKISFNEAYSNLMSYIFLPKNVKVFQWLLKSKFISFMTKRNSNNGNDTKWDIFHRTCSNMTSFFSDCKILKYFKDLLIGTFKFHCRSNYKQVKSNIIKWDKCKSNSIFLYFLSRALFKWLLILISW